MTSNIKKYFQNKVSWQKRLQYNFDNFMSKGGLSLFFSAFLTNQFVSKILAQVSQEPNVMSIYRDLFSVEGSELYIKPISLYFPIEQLGKLTLADCVKAAQERDELCIGVKISKLAQDRDKNFGIDLVPNLDKELNLTL